jgi:hypothetical protein
MLKRANIAGLVISNRILGLQAFAGCALLFSCAGGGASSPNAIDGGSDADTDAEIVGDVCENYPAADDNFLHGSVPRNYTFFDAAGNESHLCDYSDKRLALLVISDGES